MVEAVVEVNLDQIPLPDPFTKINMKLISIIDGDTPAELGAVKETVTFLKQNKTF